MCMRCLRFCFDEGITVWRMSSALEAMLGRYTRQFDFDLRKLPYYWLSRDEACRQRLQTNAVFEEVRAEVHQVPTDDFQVVEHTLDGLQVWRVGG